MTTMVNYVVDHAGMIFLYRLEEELGADCLEVLSWYLAADELSGARTIREKIFEMDYEVAPQYQYSAWQRVRDSLGNITAWLYDALRNDHTPESSVGKFQSLIKQHKDTILEHLDRERRDRMDQHREKWKQRGFDDEFNYYLSHLSYMIPMLDILWIHIRENEPVEKIADQYFKLGSELNID
ncbi:MAG: hypothetical protein ABEJ65_07130, partial [bacterium]